MTSAPKRSPVGVKELTTLAVGAGVAILGRFMYDKMPKLFPQNSEPMILGYWKIRGLAQPIRLFLGWFPSYYRLEFEIF